MQQVLLNLVCKLTLRHKSHTSLIEMMPTKSFQKNGLLPGIRLMESQAYRY